jgi:peptidoglycan/LPS O-acetylase OafA/YrhL
MVQAKARRYQEMDALRGLGASSVALSHFLIAFVVEPQWHEGKLKMIAYWLGMVFYGGHSALPFFFMLSGFVLALPAVNNKPQSYSVFITRRGFRLYVPYVVALAIAILGNSRWHGPLYLTSWVNQTWPWPGHVDKHQVLQHLLIFGPVHWAQFNTAFWTLIVSLRLSVVFPVLCYMVLRTRPLVSTLAVAFTAFVVTWYQLHGVINSYTMTLHMTGFFIVGILLARYKDEVFAWASALSERRKTVYLFVALFVYWYSGMLLQLFWKHNVSSVNFRLVVFDWAIASGSIMILILSIEFKPLSRILMSRFPQFMGRICYSVYLMHGTVLFVLLYTLSHKWPPLAIFLVYVPSVLCASSLFHYTIEKPSMNFGRSITKSTPQSNILTTAEAHASWVMEHDSPGSLRRGV